MIDDGELRWRGGWRLWGVDGGGDGGAGLEVCTSGKGLDVEREKGDEASGFLLWCG